MGGWVLLFATINGTFMLDGNCVVELNLTNKRNPGWVGGSYYLPQSMALSCSVCKSSVSSLSIPWVIDDPTQENRECSSYVLEVSDDAKKPISPESFFWKCGPGLSQMHTFMLDGNHLVGFNLTNKRNPGWVGGSYYLPRPMGLATTYYLLATTYWLLPTTCRGSETSEI